MSPHLARQLLVAILVALAVSPAASVHAAEKTSPVTTADVLTGADLSGPDLPAMGTFEPVPDYEPQDPEKTPEQYAAEVEAYSSADFRWDWVHEETGSGRAQDPALPPLPGPRGRAGIVSPSQALTSGSRMSVLGVPNAATLVHSTIVASKTVNGRQYNALCQYELWTGTPRATRTIEIGMSWNCNQPYIRGMIFVGGAGTNRPDGTIYEEGLSQPDGTPVNRQISIDGTLLNRTYAWSVLYDRTFEHQLQHLYGYLVLSVDGSTGPSDAFFGNPTAEGAVSRAQCNQSSKPTVTCEIVTQPFTFIPTENTQCGAGPCGDPYGAADPVLGLEPVDILNEATNDATDGPFTQLEGLVRAGATASAPVDDALSDIEGRTEQRTAPAEDTLWDAWAAEMAAIDALPQVAAQRAWARYEIAGGSNGAERKWCIKPWNTRECIKALRSRNYAAKAMLRRYRFPRTEDHWPGNAFLHCTWIGVSSTVMSNEDARTIGENHEKKARQNTSKYFFELAKKMDLNNNDWGIAIGDGTSDPDAEQAKATARGCFRRERDGTLYRIYRQQNFEL